MLRADVETTHIGTVRTFFLRRLPLKLAAFTDSTAVIVPILQGHCVVEHGFRKP